MSYCIRNYLMIGCNLLDVRANVGDRENRETFDQCVSRKHFISKADINNVRVKVQDNLIRRHKDDAISVCLFVSELKRPFHQ